MIDEEFDRDTEDELRRYDELARWIDSHESD